MAPNHQVAYGTLEVELASSKSSQSSRVFKALVVSFVALGGIAAVGLWSQQSSSGVLREIDNLDKHYCPLWSTFCKQHDECLTKYHGGINANPVRNDLCEDYVSDCTYYCDECGWSESACTNLNYCNSLFDSCMNPENFLDGPLVSNEPVCPHAYEQVGALGSGVSGCGISGCDDAAQADSVDMCSSICDSDSTCNSFTFYHNGNHPVCNIYTTDVADGPLGSVGSPTARRILCKKLATVPTAILNPECGFSGSVTSIVQTDQYYPACPADSRLFGLALGGFCCSGEACAPGKEGDDSADVVCAIEGNPAVVYNGVAVAACTGYQTDKACLWAYGSAQDVDTTYYSDYMVRASLSYYGDDAGVLFRVQSATDAAAAHYNLKFEGNKETDNLNVYYFDGSTETIVGVQGESEVQVKLETGPLSSAPADGPAMITAVDAAVATATTGYCSVDNADLGSYTNKGTCGGGINSNIAYKISATFYVAEEGDWFFDFNVDFGWGGIVQFDGVDSAEGFQAGNMWWGGNYNNPMPVDITHTMTEGWHTMVAYGAEGCCDGTSNVKFQVPGDDTLYSLTETNLKAIQPAPKPAVKANEMHSLELQVQGTTFTVLLNNELYGTFTDANIATGVIGLRTWKASMQVHNLQFLTLSGEPILHKYNGNMVGEGEWTFLVDSEVESSSVTTGEVIPIEYSNGAKTLAVEMTADDERTYLAAIGTECQIVDEAACQKIADERGATLGYLVASQYDVRPKGCFYDGGYSSHVFFNPSTTGGNLVSPYQQFCYGDGEWELIAYQVDVASNRMSSDTRTTYSYDDDGTRMMKIGDMDWSDSAYQLDGKYTMKIIWDDGESVEWSQTNTPMESYVTGAEIISEPGENYVGSCSDFEGLAKSDSGSCVIDGNGASGCWFSCIGLINTWGGGTPGYNRRAASGYELYIAKKAKTPAFAYFANNHKGTDVPVLSVDHTFGASYDGQYFNFNVAAVTAALGRALVNNEVLEITNTRTQDEREAVLWTAANGGSIGDGHGRWNSGAAPGQWVVGDSFTVQSMSIEHAGMSSMSASAANWKCTNAVSDPSYAWTASDFDRSAWTDASVLTDDSYSVIPSTVGSGLSWIGIPRTVAEAGTKMMCVLEM